MEYRIFPAIGLARLGNSSDFFIGPEVRGSLGREPGSGAEVTRFHDPNTNRKRKQAARFHLYERVTTSGRYAPAELPPGTKIRWTVRVANKKDAIQRSVPPTSIPAGGLRPMLDPARANRLIDSGNVQITGANAAAKALNGTHVGQPVRLGEVRTDAQGRLLVLGADGISKANPNTSISSFYSNANWFDDTADGTVNAEIVFANGTTQKAMGSWVIIAPPDFAPAAQPIVTLYDEIYKLAVEQGWLTKPTTTTFASDIYPLLRRARSLRWAHGKPQTVDTSVSEPNWNAISQDYANLAKTAAAQLALRTQNAALVQKVEQILSHFQLTEVQKEHLQRWQTGAFDGVWQGVPPLSATPGSASLTQAALEGMVGQGFFPGIEAGIILTDPSIYSTPFNFRINPAKLTPGDVTAQMAQPWQADFLKCSGDWWPSQRPDIAPQANGSFKQWARMKNPQLQPLTHQTLVEHVMRFGMVVARINSSGVEIGLEEGRDPFLDTPIGA